MKDAPSFLRAHSALHSNFPSGRSAQRTFRFSRPQRQRTATLELHGPAAASHAPPWHGAPHRWPHGRERGHCPGQVRRSVRAASSRARHSPQATYTASAEQRQRRRSSTGHGGHGPGWHTASAQRCGQPCGRGAAQSSEHASHALCGKQRKLSHCFSQKFSFLTLL